MRGRSWASRVSHQSIWKFGGKPDSTSSLRYASVPPGSAGNGTGSGGDSEVGTQLKFVRDNPFNMFPVRLYPTAIPFSTTMSVEPEFISHYAEL